MAIVLSLVVLALANFVAADLRYTKAVNARAETLSTAHSGIDYAVARLRSEANAVCDRCRRAEVRSV